MGLIETKAKAAAFDNAQEKARQIDLHNAGLAAYTKGLSEGQLRALAQERTRQQMAQQMQAQQNAYIQKYGAPVNDARDNGLAMQYVSDEVGPSSYSPQKRPVAKPTPGYVEAMSSGLIQ